MPSGRQHGRGEDWVAAQLTRRGHTVSQQHPVWRHDQVGQYFVDIALGNVAIELYTYWRDPWEEDRELLRVHNLVVEDWRVMYVRLYDKDVPGDGVIDAILQFSIDAKAGTHHSFRAVNATGKLIRIGWLNRSDELVSATPDEEPEWPDDSWSPDPPHPPLVAVPYTHVLAENGATPEEEAYDLEARRQWWEYNRAFEVWDAERQRRRKPWEPVTHRYPERAPPDPTRPDVASTGTNTPLNAISNACSTLDRCRAGSPVEDATSR